MTIRTSRLLLLGFFLVNLIFLSVFADRDGYEGDDLNSILPMLHLQEAKQHDLLIYRYDWQPLSYEIGALVFEVTQKPSLIFLLAPFAGAVSLALLLSIIWRRPSISEFVKALVAMMAVPELWFSGLYFNSTILGLPLALSSFALLRSNPRTPFLFLAGILLGTAALMRFDFVLAGPALALRASTPAGDDQRLSERVRVPRRARTGFEGDDRADHPRRRTALERRIDSDRAGEPLGRSFGRRL